MRPARVFLSYSARDRAYVRELFSTLRSHGVRAWLDEEGVRLREEHDRNIARALDHTAIVVLVLGEETRFRPWVHAEVSYARSRGARLIVLRIARVGVPEWALGGVFVDGCSALPGAFRQILTEIDRADRRGSRRLNRPPSS